MSLQLILECFGGPEFQLLRDPEMATAEQNTIAPAKLLRNVKCIKCNIGRWVQPRGLTFAERKGVAGFIEQEIGSRAVANGVSML